MKKRFFLYTILLITFSIISCKGKESISSAPKVEDLPWEGDINTIPTEMRELNPVASQEAKKGGAFKVYSHQYPKSLNYYLELFSTTAEIFRLMFEPLAIYHPTKLNLLPKLARSWEISPDKMTFTFHMDQNAKWSDGKPVTAHDVLFTYQTLMNPANNTPIFRIGLSRFEEPKVIDDYTIQFKAKEVHWNNFDEVAAQLFILPKHEMEGKDFNKINDTFPVVSGPYMLAEAKPGRYVKMRRRGDYWGRAYPFNKGRHNFDEIYFKVYNEEPIALQAMMKGDIDLFPVYKAATWINEAKGEKIDNFWIVKQKIFNEKPIGFQGWAMNTRKPPFDDVRVRKAIAHLVNRKEMIRKLAYNEYDPTDSYYPDFYLGENAKKNPNEPVQFEPETARKLLKEAGYKPNSKGILEKDGKELEIVVLERDKGTEKYFTTFMEVAKELGIKVKIENTDLAGWSARMDKFDFMLTWCAWGGGIFKDPEPMWHSKYADQEMQHNYPGLKIKEVDELIEKQKTIFDVEKRHAIVKQIDQIIYKQYPYVLLWHLPSTRLLYWNKFGMPKNPLGRYGGESFATDYWWFDPEKNAQLEKAIKEKQSLPKVPSEVYWKE
ncbi:MAG: extracellular solute-binding protein [Leptospiraceae bacterium]|nr:extracellular solute-binding protein [Leptospiraceae bacterium]